MTNNLFAVINVGASAVRMYISQYVDGEETTIEYNIKPLRLGRDTFTKGYITLDNVYKATRILKKFSEKLDEYGIRDAYKAICTSGIREARNKLFFIDHVRINTGIDLEIIDATEEIHIKYLGLGTDFPILDTFEKEGMMFANISSGNVVINIKHDQQQVFSASLPYGILRLREMFRHISREKRYRAYEQYAQKMVRTIRASLSESISVNHLVCAGSSINLIRKLFPAAVSYIQRSDVQRLYDLIKLMSVDEIIKRYKLGKMQSVVLLPTLTVYLHLMDFTGSDGFYFTRQSFPKQLALFYKGIITEHQFFEKVRETFFRLGSRYTYDEAHSLQVTKFSLKIFDELQQIHSLDLKAREIIEGAAILHDIGIFMGYEGHHLHSYHIIQSIRIPGVDHDTINMMALVALLHRGYDEDLVYKYASDVSEKKLLMIRKLVTLMRVADSMDCSHLQLITNFSISLESNRLLIKAVGIKTPHVELTFFKQSNKEFVETFGIPVELEVGLAYE